jgi:hypothetical protein
LRTPRRLSPTIFGGVKLLAKENGSAVGDSSLLERSPRSPMDSHLTLDV